MIPGPPLLGRVSRAATLFQVGSDVQSQKQSSDADGSGILASHLRAHALCQSNGETSLKWAFMLRTISNNLWTTYGPQMHLFAPSGS